MNKKNLANVEITCGSNASKVFIDGVEAPKATTKIEFVHIGGEVPRLKLEIAVGEICIHSRCIVDHSVAIDKAAEEIVKKMEQAILI